MREAVPACEEAVPAAVTKPATRAGPAGVGPGGVVGFSRPA
jgi:hypothetical protein